MALSAGTKVKAARYILGWNQSELAKRAGIGRRTLVDFETGNRTSQDTQTKIEAALGFGLSDPPIEAAFYVLANDYASADLVTMALALLEAADGR